MKKALLALTALIVIGFASAQAKVPLAITCNENNADVYVNDQILARTGRNLVIRLPAGVYSVRISKAGFQDYVNPQVALNSVGGVSLKVTLVPGAAAAPAAVPAKPAPGSLRGKDTNSLRGPAPVVAAPPPAPVVAAPPPAVVAAPPPAPVVAAPPPAVVAAPPPATVQAKPAPVVVAPPARTVERGYAVTIDANVNGAQVYVNEQYMGQTPVSLGLTRGVYELRVAAPGYLDFAQRATVHGPMRVNAILQAAMSQVTITANVQGADVILNGGLVGKTPFSAPLAMGSYSVIVRAPGFFDFQRDLMVGAAPLQVDALLQPQSCQLAINANVVGASVFLNGQMVGRTPFAAPVAPGAYALVVRAPGYMDYQADLAVSAPQTVNAVLQGALASWRMVLPDSVAKKGGRNFNEGGRREVQLWVDGAPDRDFAGQLTPGRHALRLVIGDLDVDMQLDVQAGRSYVLEPFLGINVK